MVRRVRSLSIALVIVLVASVVSGQQPKRKREPYIAPLLPAEQAWKVALPSPPAAAAVMDASTVYVPLEAREAEEDVPEPSPELVALDRATGTTRWTIPITTRHPPVLARGVIVVATTKTVQAVDPGSGQLLWTVALDRSVRAPMLVEGSLLLAMLEGDELVAIDLDRQQVAWRRSVGESGPVLMTVDADAVYLAKADSHAMAVTLSDGLIRWERRLEGELTQPTVDRDLLFVGGGSNARSLWALNVRTGEPRWDWHGKVFGGAVVGTAVRGDRVYVVSRDNMVRALDRGSGNQRWAKPAGRPIQPPRLFDGIIAVVGLSTTLSTFRADTGAAVSTWDAPDELVLQGAPLIDTPAPFLVAVVAVFRNGQVIGLKPTEMLFKEPPLTPLTTLPGRPLQREQ